MPPPPIQLASAPAVAVPPSPALPRSGDNVMRGILYLVSATLLFSVSDITSKYVSQTLPVIEVAWVRYFIFVLLTFAPATKHGIASLRTRKPGMQALRGFGVVMSAILFVMGLQRLPIADAAAINFVAPLFITMLSVPLLGEKVDARRWAAVGVGLAGACIAAQPGTSAFQPAAIFPIASAGAWAFAIILTRKLAVTDKSGVTLAWSAMSGLIVLTALLPFFAQVPTWRELAGCLVIGFAASAGQSLVVMAYRQGPASMLAPFSYLQLIWSTLLGIAVFAAQPGLATIVGGCVIAGSGLYAASQERKRAPRR